MLRFGAAAAASVSERGWEWSRATNAASLVPGRRTVIEDEPKEREEHGRGCPSGLA
jgi:hypothetical protein